MGILTYEDFETEEEVRARREAEVENSNRNYTGNRLPERAPRRDSSSEDEPVRLVLMHLNQPLET